MLPLGTLFVTYLLFKFYPNKKELFYNKPNNNCELTLNEKRNKIMPINESNSLGALKDAMIYFSEKTGTRPTLEYIIFKDFNDEIIDAEELVQFVKSFPSKVNIIEYNSIDDGKYQQADPIKVDAFADYLESKNVIVNIRRSRGKDIDAACGQLANKNELAN